MVKMFSAVLLLAVAGLTNAYLDQGNCPSIKHVDEFDLPSYMGRWFETHRYPDGIEKGRACVTADYVLVNDTRFSIRNSANLHDGSIELLHGNAVTTDTPGRFIVGFQGEPPIVYNVLATDYATYSSVYSCAEDHQKQHFGVSYVEGYALNIG
ncbi:apolipoprotein D-like [Hyalella azteca]|uniref:Apolipoprotein D-like n=1 Tax=Hyalella azteca TaxID=294128 RepID=A0A8B7NGN5_HYAAZ|nr:apolipoprotein D-like [Hyalella azteca]